MNIFGTFKTYFISEKQSKNGLQAKQQNKPPSRKLSSDSFELILEDIISEAPNKNHLKKEKQSKKNIQPQESNQQSSDVFQILEPQEDDLQEKDEPQEEIQNMYVPGIVFINKYSEGQEITLAQWNEMIKEGNLSLQSQKNIYFSILKGIHFSVRKRVWDLLANTREMKTYTERPYQQLVREDLVQDKSQIVMIDKDVPRSVNITKHTKQLRNILIAYVNFSGHSYTQGMNLIAGSLIEMLSFENDSELQDFAIMEDNFEESVFWVFVGVMKYRNWEYVFEKDLSGLKEMLSKLQKLMVEYVPTIYQKIVDYEWDLTIFSQYYITILLYNTPKEFSKIILDLFLLDGENVIHSLVIRMLKLNEDRIVSIMDEGELMNYFKREMIQETFQNLEKDKFNAQKLEDFQINFIESKNL